MTNQSDKQESQKLDDDEEDNENTEELDKQPAETSQEYQINTDDNIVQNSGKVDQNNPQGRCLEMLMLFV